MTMTIWPRLASYLAGLVGGGVGLLFILPLGLVVVEWVIFPLALVVGALLAALAAGWVGTWTAGDGTRTRLAAVVVATEVAALGLAMVVLVAPPLRERLLGPVLGLAGLADLGLALAASAATWALRHQAGAPHRDRALTLILLVLVLIGVPVVLVLAGLAGLTGA